MSLYWLTFNGDVVQRDTLGVNLCSGIVGMQRERVGLVLAGVVLHTAVASLLADTGWVSDDTINVTIKTTHAYGQDCNFLRFCRAVQGRATGS